MVKVQPKKIKGATHKQEGESTHQKKGGKKKKRKKMMSWKSKTEGVQKKIKEEFKSVSVVPPKAPQEFSSNWKAFQELLKQETNAETSATAQERNSEKEHKNKVLKKKGAAASSHADSTSHRSGGKMDSEPAADTLKPAALQESGKKVSKHFDKKKASSKNNQQINGQTPSEEKMKHKKRENEAMVEQKPAEPDIWFDDVDPEDIEAGLGSEVADFVRKQMGLQQTKPLPQSEKNMLVKEKAFDGLTKVVAMDCEMVGVGPSGEDSIVARVSLVNQFGKCVYDKYVQPMEKVTDYRTAVSGIRPEHINNGENLKVVQQEVANILKDRTLVGHAIHNDLKVLFLDHPKKKIRDTQKYKPFRKKVQNGRPSLKLLCEKILLVKVQESEHCSVEDAQAAMRLYTMFKKQWEADIKAKYTTKKAAAKQQN
ncbi:RNA exonuclease 4 [Latimeria chalumnae]|uniref:RNA exonuclease 4 n=1 Tax=Latimeria chalumnae TaxID=7897 RepID=H3AWR6_LATCH|nr:PREDICTED: RNA exonuclease 4 [Latimeria chalumnae]XP_005990672.1 PREDICTED: RNA exonuclease 4 [Latimeria chalumnae]|eukprot:XP_005990671.1 PREDICTED: RNA exonuclease 4 [Latimeria chalumnae]